jgi:hypothetical protein
VRGNVAQFLGLRNRFLLLVFLVFLGTTTSTGASRSKFPVFVTAIQQNNSVASLQSSVSVAHLLIRYGLTMKSHRRDVRIFSGAAPVPQSSELSRSHRLSAWTMYWVLYLIRNRNLPEHLSSIMRREQPRRLDDLFQGTA